MGHVVSGILALRATLVTLSNIHDNAMGYYAEALSDMNLSSFEHAGSRSRMR
jgi:hypothetical protein